MQLLWCGCVLLKLLRLNYVVLVILVIVIGVAGLVIVNDMPFALTVGFTGLRLGWITSWVIYRIATLLFSNDLPDSLCKVLEGLCICTPIQTLL